MAIFKMEEGEMKGQTWGAIYILHMETSEHLESFDFVVQTLAALSYTRVNL